MYIKNEISKKVIEEKCYILKQDLQCKQGTFTTGSKVKILHSYVGSSNEKCAYIVKSADGEDYLYLSWSVPVDEWVKEMLIEDTESTLKYQAVMEYEEKERELQIIRSDAKDGFLWVLLSVVIIVGIVGICVVQSVLNKIIICVGLIIGIALVRALFKLSADRTYRTMARLRGRQEQKLCEILSSKADE